MLGEVMNKYFQELNYLPCSAIITKMRNDAIEHKVPIISDEGLVFLLFLIRLHQSKRILEIGTAIGFSAIHMALLDYDMKVETIERDETFVLQARENIKEAGLSDQITVIHQDALECKLKELAGNYDLIFIDAAKAQYQKFFTRFSPLLSNHGIIVTDNLLFHGLVESSEDIPSKNLRHLVEKIDSYNQWLKSNPEFETTFFDLGDGMAVSSRGKHL